MAAERRLDPIVGVDIGGTGIKGAPVDTHAGKFTAERVRLLTPSPATPQAVAGVVGEVLDQIGVGGPVGLTLPAGGARRDGRDRSEHRPGVDRR